MSIELNLNELPIAAVAEEVAVEVIELPVTMAEILEAEFDDDDEAEFLQGVLMIQQEIENVILSDNPEDFLLPDGDELPPALQLIEMIDKLKGYKFGNRTLRRMERRIRGENLVIDKLTQLEKSEHPEYKNWCCPKCLNFYKGARGLKFHREREICRNNNKRLVVKPMEKQVPKPSFLHTASVMEDLYVRVINYKKNIEPELKEEVIEEENNICQGCEKVKPYSISIGCVCDDCKYKTDDEEDEEYSVDMTYESESESEVEIEV